MLRGLMMDRPLLVSSLIEHAAAWHGDAEIVTRTVEGPIHRYTYADAARRIARLANALVRLGVKPGDRVATLAWNTHRHFELYFAISGIGAVLHTVNPRLHPDQIAYIVEHAGDTVLLFDLTYGELVRQVAPRVPGVAHWIALTDAAHRPDLDLPGLRTYEEFIAPEEDRFDWPEFDENTASSLCYTSGTTGNPKGALYAHRSTVLHAMSVCMADVLGLSNRDTVLPIVPMFHVNAWGIPYAAAMAGAKLILPGPGMDGASLHALVEGEGVTLALGVPTVWLGLLCHVRDNGLGFGRLERIVVGGSALPPSLLEAYEGHGVTVMQAWGMTETSPVGVVNRPKPKHDALPPDGKTALKLKAGRAIYGVELRTVAEDGTTLPRDGKSAGHLQVRGPWIIGSYFRRDDDPAFTADGWFDTGDVATLDADGYMQITDRAKDVIKSGGEWISSIDLENAAMLHPGVLQAAVIGIAHARWQERPLLVVVPRPGHAPDAEGLRHFLEGKVAKWWLPDAVEFVDALPIGGTGKVLKTALRERFRDYRLPDCPDNRR
ncbi:MAG TPA: 3-(methylthio)propionyl-CoA ligase [Azospirillaceae bacterium]|nr:3-(methylthio)propionyl-CoA ligase [Azospirillaceae bacterium]